MKENYDFDYSKAKPNMFADKFEDDTITVVLYPDVVALFQTPKEVNHVL